MVAKVEVFMKKVQTEFGDMENIFEIIKPEDSSLEYWTLFFNFAYRFLYCPFRLVCNSSGMYELRSYSLLPTVIRCTVIIIGNLLFLRSMKSLMDNFASENKEIFYFDFASLFSATFYLLYSHCILWYKRQPILSIAAEIVKILKSFQPPKQHECQFKLSFRARAVTIVIFVLFFKLALNVLAELERNDWSFQHWWISLESFAPKLIFLPQFVCTGLYTLFNYYNCLAITFADTFLLATALMYSDILRNFCSSLENHDFQKVMTNFKTLKQLTADMNDVFGLYILGFTFSVTTFYTAHLLNIIDTAGITPRLVNILYTLHFSVIFYQIARANSMWDRFYHWLRKKENYENDNLSLKELTVILHESKLNALGLPEIFVITFSSLGKLAGMVLTYIVVVMQLRDSMKQ